MITVSDVSKAFGGRKLFEEVNTSFAPGNRYGLTGPNGSGKSTFMLIVAGDIESDTGHIARPKKTSVLRQDHSMFNDLKVLDVVMMGNAGLWAAMTERDELYASGEYDDAVGMRLAELEDVIADEDGYTAEPEAESLLQGLGIGQDLHAEIMGSLSGGMKVRVLLAQALFGKPEAMILDEPTNHLDLETIRWLERYLDRYRGTLIVISHDRRFLNSVCTHIADIDYETIITYPGNYDEMVRTKAHIRGAMTAQYDAKQRKVKDLKEFIQRFSAGTRASQVQSRKKQVEKLSAAEIKRSNIARPYIRFDLSEESGKHIVDVQELSKSFDGAPPLYQEFRSHVNRGDHIGIIGRDGVGKTTLVRMLMGEIEADTGKIEWGQKTKVAYLPQEHDGAIEPGNLIVPWLHGFKPGADLEDIHALLGRMLFRGDEANKQTDFLSGGERVRMLMCQMMLEGPNVLVLDEPTNHLDLESINALAEGLAAYKGTLILVTHDRSLLNDSCDRIWSINGNEIMDFRGSYDDWEERHGK